MNRNLILKRRIASSNFALLTCFLLCSAVQAQSQPAPANPKVQQSLTLTPVYPLDTVVTSDKTAYIVDRNLPGILVWKADKLSVFCQGSKKYREPFNAARSIALDQEGNLLAGDSSTREVYRFNAEGQPQALIDGEIGIPMDIAVAADGTMYIADLERHVLFKKTKDGKPEIFAKVNPRGVTVDSQGSIWVISQDADTLLKVAADGTAKPVVKGRPFEFPHQVAVNAAGDAFISDGYKKAIWKVAAGSDKAEVWFQGEPLINPVGLCWDGEDLIVTDPRAFAVFRLTPDGKIKKWFDVSAP